MEGQDERLTIFEKNAFTVFSFAKPNYVSDGEWEFEH